MRRPVDAPFKLGDGTAEHAARKIGPAQDYGVPIGTPVRASFDVVRFVRLGGPNADGGHELRGYAANGDYFSVQHLSEFRDYGAALEGEVIALSGNSGRKTRGPHVHHFVSLGGVRINPEDRGLYSTVKPASAAAQALIERITMADKTLVKIVSYVSQTPRNGKHLAGPGFFHTFTAEEWDYFNWQKDSDGKTMLQGIPVDVPPTDRAFDVTRDFYLSLK